MTRIGVRELRQDASRYLRLVEAGETVEVTSRGRLVALLVPPRPGDGARDRLVAAGLLQPAARPFVVPAPLPPLGDGSGTADVLDELREDRL